MVDVTLTRLRADFPQPLHHPQKSAGVRVPSPQVAAFSHGLLDDANGLRQRRRRGNGRRRWQPSGIGGPPNPGTAILGREFPALSPHFRRDFVSHFSRHCIAIVSPRF
jgi:hypothetical protein